MPEEKITADRLAAYSDAVFAVIVTIMVLELRAPDQPAFSALWPLWPTAISYRGELPVHRHYLDKPPLPHSVH
jgi:TMEM175 potassium channel family protein